MTKGHNKSKVKASPLKVFPGLKRKKSPKPDPNEATAPDGAEDPGLAERRRKEIVASRRRSGRLGASLTGALGDPSEPTVTRKKLGG